MNKPDVPNIALHEDPDLFRAAVSFTARTTTFAPRLIEKDYFCTVLLDFLAAGGEWVFKGGTCLAKVHADCISRIEAFAEKFRAALSRREVAVRDFYDIDYAVRRLDLRPEEGELIELVRQKMAVPGNDPVDVSERRMAALRQQVGPQLRPVLRAKDFAEFNLDRAVRAVTDMAARVE